MDTNHYLTYIHAYSQAYQYSAFIRNVVTLQFYDLSFVYSLKMISLYLFLNRLILRHTFNALLSLFHRVTPQIDRHMLLRVALTDGCLNIKLLCDSYVFSLSSIDHSGGCLHVSPTHCPKNMAVRLIFFRLKLGMTVYMHVCHGLTGNLSKVFSTHRPNKPCKVKRLKTMDGWKAKQTVGSPVFFLNFNIL